MTMPRLPASNTSYDEYVVIRERPRPKRAGSIMALSSGDGVGVAQHRLIIMGNDAVVVVDDRNA